MSDRADTDGDAGVDADAERLLEASVRAVRLGHGANCSSVGSVVDTLFVGAAVGGAILAAILAAMKEEPFRVVGGDGERSGADGIGGDGAAEPPP